MAARAIGSATISFGLVSIPVKLYTATDSGSAISFNLLHEKCGSRLKQHYVCPKDGETVARDQMVKGFEFSKGQYVTFTADELKALDAVATNQIEISAFVPVSKVDPVYYDKAWFLGPDKGGDKAYQLLSRTMRDTGRAALATHAARGKQYLVMLRPIDTGIVLQQLRYADEVRSFHDVPLATFDVKDAELALARQIVEQIAVDEFHPESFHDEVRDRIREQIQRKVEGQEIQAEPVEAGTGQIIDLMEALKASLKGPGKPETRGTAAPKKKAAAERRPAARSSGAGTKGGRKSAAR